jgi:c-di-GMP-binding flagellar brake protein YcgR
MNFNFKLEEIKYTKLLYTDSEGQQSSAKIIIKSFNNHEIFAYSKFDESLLNIDKAKEVKLNMVCNDGLYSSKTVIKKIEDSYPYIFFVLKTPENVFHEQKREYFRVNVKYDCVCEVTVDGGKREFRTETVDLSANGVLIILPALINYYDSITLLIGVEGRVISIQARLVRAEMLALNSYKTSFTFVKISRQDQDYISQVCIKKQLEDKRKSVF